LRPYQAAGVSWLRFLDEFGFGGCLADDMGLGKTIQLLAFLEDRRRRGISKRPTLVVVPRSLIFNWHQEATRFTPELRVLEYTGIHRGQLRKKLAKVDLVLTTYGTVRRDILQLKEVEFDYVVLDEAQAIKNPASQVAKATRLIPGERRIALSGTPIENHLRDLWSIFEFLNPGMLGRASVFKLHTTDSNDDESRRLLSHALRPFILRRTKREVARELPEKLEQTIYCHMPKQQEQLYHELRDHYRETLLGRVRSQGLGKSKIHVLEALLRLRQAACHPALLDEKHAEEPTAKLEALGLHLADLLAEGHKALVFSQFTSFLAIVQKFLDDRGMSYEYLDGQTRNRRERIERFQNDPNCGVFLISLKAGGLGLNLTSADYVFLLDPWWNPAVEMQAIDRAHRIGQTRTVFAYRLICKDTVEEKIAELQTRKKELADAILQADNNLLGELTADDLELLLS
jgi:SNF2 family DNA or RNA helicase